MRSKMDVFRMAVVATEGDSSFSIPIHDAYRSVIVPESTLAN